ncbi:MAG: hypothetical protein MN733_27855 [Nitrososphaera sp.]|nr:hypothetical protein [Nitrososphaera sp.]
MQKSARLIITGRIAEDIYGYNVITARTVYGWIVGETGSSYQFKEELGSPAYEWLPKKSKNFTWKILGPEDFSTKRSKRRTSSISLKSLDAKKSLEKVFAKLVKSWNTPS